MYTDLIVGEPLFGRRVTDMYGHTPNGGSVKDWTVESFMTIPESAAFALYDTMPVLDSNRMAPLNKIGYLVAMKDDLFTNEITAVTVLYLYDTDYYIAVLVKPKPAPTSVAQEQTEGRHLRSIQNDTVHIDPETIEGNHNSVLDDLGYTYGVGLKITAVKIYRSVYGVGLTEAKSRLEVAAASAAKRYMLPRLAPRD